MFGSSVVGKLRLGLSSCGPRSWWGPEGPPPAPRPPRRSAVSRAVHSGWDRTRGHTTPEQPQATGTMGGTLQPHAPNPRVRTYNRTKLCGKTHKPLQRPGHARRRLLAPPPAAGGALSTSVPNDRRCGMRGSGNAAAVNAAPASASEMPDCAEHRAGRKRKEMVRLVENRMRTPDWGAGISVAAQWRPCHGSAIPNQSTECNYTTQSPSSLSQH